MARTNGLGVGISSQPRRTKIESDVRDQHMHENQQGNLFFRRHEDGHRNGDEARNERLGSTRARERYSLFVADGRQACRRNASAISEVVDDPIKGAKSRAGTSLITWTRVLFPSVS